MITIVFVFDSQPGSLGNVFVSAGGLAYVVVYSTLDSSDFHRLARAFSVVL